LRAPPPTAVPGPSATEPFASPREARTPHHELQTSDPAAPCQRAVRATTFRRMIRHPWFPRRSVSS
jgi:hypothetical protein